MVLKKQEQQKNVKSFKIAVLVFFGLFTPIVS